MTEYLQGFMPVLSSAKGHLGDELNGYVHILMALLMVGWGIFFIYCLYRFSEKNNPKASYSGVTNHYSKYVEGGIVLFEAVLLIGLEYWYGSGIETSTIPAGYHCLHMVHVIVSEDM